MGNDIEKVVPMGKGSGEIGISVGTFKFPNTAASSGNATLEVSVVAGAALTLTPLFGSTVGAPIGTHTDSATESYAVTNTTFRFGEMTWSMRPANIVNGVARTLYMVRRENAQCVQGITATKQ